MTMDQQLTKATEDERSTATFLFHTLTGDSSVSGRLHQVLGTTGLLSYSQ